MRSQPATMAEGTRPRANPLHRGLPDEIVTWEILIRLPPPNSLLRCRAVCRAWRIATSTHDFLLTHHGRQRSLPIICGSEYRGACHQNILVLDHHLPADAQLQPAARLDGPFHLEASCDGLLILSISKYDDMFTGSCFYVCNPATRQHAPLRQISGFKFLGMYLHRPTGEYRLLLHGRIHIESTAEHLVNKRQIGCYVFALGSDQPPRFIGAMEAPSALCSMPTALARDSLHWYPVHQRELVVLVFDTTSESFWHMRAPVVSCNSYIFETDGTLGIYSCDDAMEIVDIWVLRDYESQVWDCKCRIELPAKQIRTLWVWWQDQWDVRVVSGDSDFLVMVTYGQWLCYVDTSGKLVASFRRDSQDLYACQRRLKQTLVQHTFFSALEGYTVNASPFI